MAYDSFTAGDIVTDVQGIIGEYGGTGTQLFAEDALLAKVGQAFDLCFLKYAWPHYIRWNTITLDATTGRATTNDFEDIPGALEHFIAVRQADSDTPIPMLPFGRNPNRVTGSGKPTYFTSIPVSEETAFQQKRLQFYPLEADADVDIMVRLRPATFAEDTKIYLDRQLITFGTAWLALSDDGMNEGAAVAKQTLFDMRFRDIMKAFSNHPVTVTVDTGYPTTWAELP